MRSIRRHRTAGTRLAATTATVLALTACAGDDEAGPAKESSTTESVTVSVPRQFNSSAPAWKTIPDIEGGREADIAFSSDGKNMAYAYSTDIGGTVEVGQIDLATGKRGKEQSVKALADPATDKGGFSLGYSGHRWTLLQTGPGKSDSKGKWNVSVFRVGSASKPQVLRRQVEGAATPTGSPVAGPLVSASMDDWASSYFGVDVDRMSVQKIPTKPPKPLPGCGGSSCKLPLQPRAQMGDSTVVTFTETPSGGKTVCSESVTDIDPAPNGFDKCLTGFGTQKWSSQDADIAPKAAEARSAYLYGAGHNRVVGQWMSKKGDKTIYRTINVANPDRGHAEVTCKESDLSGSAMNEVVSSPSGRYVAAGAVVFDTHKGDGYCFDDVAGASGDTRFVAVDDSGTAWGTTEDKWMEHRYTSEAVKVDVGSHKLSRVKGTVALPSSFVKSHGRSVGVFAVADDARDGAVVVAGYPVRR